MASPYSAPSARSIAVSAGKGRRLTCIQIIVHVASHNLPVG
jgi:hypothetical protein